MEPGRRFLDHWGRSLAGRLFCILLCVLTEEIGSSALVQAPTPYAILPQAKGSDINQAWSGTSNVESQGKPFFLRRPCLVFIIVMEDSSG